MKNILTISFLLCFAFSNALLLGCNSNGKKNKAEKDGYSIPYKNKVQSITAYIDTLLQRPYSQYTNSSLIAVNALFKRALPLSMYSGTDKTGDTTIVVSTYNPKDSVRIIRLSLPQSITDALVISQLTAHFGKLRPTNATIAPPKQPLSRYIDISEKAHLELYFNDSVPIDSAHVRSVEIYKHQ